MSEPVRVGLPRPLIIGAILTALASALLFAKVIPLGIPDEWVWRYWPPEVHPPLLSPMLLPALVLGLLAFVALRASGGRALRRWEVVVAVAAAVVLHATLLLVAVPSLTPAGGRTTSSAVRMGQLSASPVSFGYYMAAREAGDAATLLAMHEQVMADPQAPERVRTHPPGPALVYVAVNSIFDSLPYSATQALASLFGVADEPPGDLARTIEGPIALGISDQEALGAIFAGYVTVLLGALAIIPIFLLGREVGGVQVGLASAFIYAVTPSALVFVPSIDAWLTALAATCLWLTLLTARRNSLWLAAAAGCAFWAALQVSFGAIALAPMIGILLFLVGRPSLSLRRMGLLFLVMMGVAAALALLMWGAASYNAFHAAILSRTAHAGVTARRTYAPWVVFDLADVAFGLGLCATVCLIATARALLPGIGRTAPIPAEAALLAATLAVLALLDLSGTVRAEVARIWQFLMPPLLIAPLAWLERSGRRFAATVLLLFACQLVQALAMYANVAFMVAW